MARLCMMHLRAVLTVKTAPLEIHFSRADVLHAFRKRCATLNVDTSMRRILFILASGVEMNDSPSVARTLII